MASKYAYVVAANGKYFNLLTVFLNTLENVKNTQDVHVISWGLPEIRDYPFRVIRHEVKDEPFSSLGEAEVLMRYRYELAANLDCDAVCVMDADTMVIRNLDIWFDIAANANVIIGCALEQKRWYGEPENNHRVNGEHFIPRTWAEKDICCSPLFFNPRTFGDSFRFSWSIVADYPPDQRFRGPDMDAINMAIIKFGYTHRVIALAEATWSGLHETLLKPFSHVCEMHGNLWTINGEEIWVIHGQFDKENWQGWQIEGQLGCIDRELDGSPRCKDMARNCLDFLVRYFNRWT